LRPTAGGDSSGGGPGPFGAVESDYVYLLMPVRLPG